ncbi:MAG TPA: class I SAM-dependent methyltransferase [Planktothrix sp.]
MDWLQHAELEEINRLCAAGEYVHVDGSSVKFELIEALANASRDFVYPVIDGIYCFLPHLAIARKNQARGRVTDREAVRELAKFYDEFGWKKSAAGDDFCDAQVFEDLRPVSAKYIRDCHLRVNNYLPSSGKYIADIASGAIQFDEYLTYSQNFQYRVCVDVSMLALKEARARIGDRGIFVLGDIVELPIHSDSVDAIVSLHTVYHVDHNKQHAAFDELHRVVKPKAPAVIIYTWGNHCTLMNILGLPAAMTKPFRDALQGRRAHSPAIYFQPHGPSWFEQKNWGFVVDRYVWRSVSVTFLKTYVHKWFFGAQILLLVYWLEQQFPALMGLIGQYPLFIVRKSS